MLVHVKQVVLGLCAGPMVDEYLVCNRVNDIGLDQIRLGYKHWCNNNIPCAGIAAIWCGIY